LRLALVVFYVIASRRRGNLISEWHRESSGGSIPMEIVEPVPSASEESLLPVCFGYASQ